jgi:hypothetical protein
METTGSPEQEPQRVPVTLRADLAAWLGRISDHASVIKPEDPSFTPDGLIDTAVEHFVEVFRKFYPKNPRP